MMNTPESSGEPSCKRQENGDASTGPERTLKKARFAWQVKGKYHLKNDTPETPATAPPNDPETPGCSSQSDSNMGNTEQNLEILGDYLLKQDFNTLDSVIADSDKSLLKPSTSLSPEKIQYPRYYPRYYERRRSSSLCDQDPRSMVPMAAALNYSEDQCIARWQARQMAKGFVDNTINRVLESWMYAPIPTDVDNNRYISALNVAEFMNNLPGDNSIENEGILMAISAHGLQNNSSSSNNDSSEVDQPYCRSFRTTEDRFIHIPQASSPLQSDDETFNDTDNNNSSIEGNSSFGNMGWFSDHRDLNNPHSPFALFPDTDSLDGNNHLQNSNIEFEDGNASSNDVLTSHYDFMDAAVSFAIQNKGLTSFDTEYG